MGCNRKRTFLDECTVAVSKVGTRDVYCSDVVEGSIKVTLAGSEKDLESAVQLLTGFGDDAVLDLPSFPEMKDLDADLDECATDKDNNCHAEAICIDFVNTFSCACKDGFFGDGVECVPDKDECVTMTGNNPDHNCHANATCTNVIGGPGTF